MFCSECGAKNPDGSRFCSSCGCSSISRVAQNALDSSQTELTPNCQPPVPASRIDTDQTELGLVRNTIIAKRYLILDLLGTGGMGKVYLAEDQSLGIRVAIKVLREVLARDPGSVKRLVTEARLAIQLAHPNIVRVNHFEDGETIKFLVMEFVEGETLARLIANRGPLPEDEVRRVAIEICRGLEHAHEKKVIHRDIKPGNILFGRDGSIKIADFGIARECRNSMSRLTSQEGAGTLLYMSPEQLDGESDERSDIYSMGIMIYEMLSGDVPFRSGDVAGQIRNNVPKPLRGVSQDISAVVMRCLEKMPQSRFASVKELRAALEETTEKVLIAEKRKKQKAVRAKETHLDQLYAKALKDIEAQNWLEAIAGFQAVLQLDSGYRDAPSHLARARKAEEAERKASEDAARMKRERKKREVLVQSVAERLARIAKEKAEAERKTRERAEAERKARERAKAERKARERVITAATSDKVRLLHELKGHAGKVICIAFAPDGRLLASGSADQTVRIWRVSDGVELFTLSRKSSRYAYGLSLAFSPDGNVLAVGSADGALVLWSIPIVDGAHPRSLEGHDRSVTCLSFSTDGRLLASGYDGGTVRLWQVSDARRLHSLEWEGFLCDVVNVAFSKDGSVLAAMNGVGEVRTWLVSDGRLICKIKGQLNAQDLLDRSALDPARGVLKQASAGQQVWLWRITNDVFNRALKGHTGKVLARALALSPDGSVLASGSHDQTVKLWRASDAALLNTLKGHTKQVNCVVFSPDGTVLASGSGGEWGREDDAVRLWGAM